MQLALIADVWFGSISRAKIRPFRRFDSSDCEFCSKNCLIMATMVDLRRSYLPHSRPIPVNTPPAFAQDHWRTGDMMAAYFHVFAMTNTSCERKLSIEITKHVCLSGEFDDAHELFRHFAATTTNHDVNGTSGRRRPAGIRPLVPRYWRRQSAALCFQHQNEIGTIFFHACEAREFHKMCDNSSNIRNTKLVVSDDGEID